MRGPDPLRRWRSRPRGRATGFGRCHAIAATVTNSPAPVTGTHESDRLGADLGIEHRLAPPMRPQTNGMVERFNGRIEDVLQSHRFRSGEELEQTILRYVRLYNCQLPQSVLKGRTPIDALKDWHQHAPELFKKRPYNRKGWDT